MGGSAPSGPGGRCRLCQDSVRVQLPCGQWRHSGAAFCVGPLGLPRLCSHDTPGRARESLRGRAGLLRRSVRPLDGGVGVHDPDRGAHRCPASSRQRSNHSVNSHATDQRLRRFRGAGAVFCRHGLYPVRVRRRDLVGGRQPRHLRAGPEHRRDHLSVRVDWGPLGHPGGAVVHRVVQRPHGRASADCEPGLRLPCRAREPVDRMARRTLRGVWPPAAREHFAGGHGRTRRGRSRRDTGGHDQLPSWGAHRASPPGQGLWQRRQRADPERLRTPPCGTTGAGCLMERYGGAAPGRAGPDQAHPSWGYLVGLRDRQGPAGTS